MSDIETLLAKCQALGATFSPTPDGKLKVRAPAPLPDTLRQALKQRKAEILAVLQSPDEGEPLGLYPELPTEHPTDDWRCGYCGNPTTIDEVCRSLDGQRWLALWHCEPCQSYGVTPDAVKSPPVWVKRTAQ